ncbi:hypothetical protein C0J52_04221 [Blattella germanica]|nr:hypothetical protein C0J52_04221 [Blattella germanica]
MDLSSHFNKYDLQSAICCMGLPETLFDFEEKFFEDAPLMDACTAACIGDHEYILSIWNSKNRDTLWQKNKNGWTPFMYACYNDHDIIVTLLFTCNACCCDRSSDGMTPLMYAALNGNIELMTLLCKNSDINATDKRGWTALFYATSRRRETAVRFLLHYRADVSKRSLENGYSVLMVAAASGKIGIVRLLLQYGANPAIVSWNGDTALTVAYNNGFFQIVRLLSDSARQCENHLLSLFTLLKSLDLENYYVVFQQRRIDLETFYTLSEENLRDIGINLVGPRKKMIRVILEWQQNQKHRASHANVCKYCCGLYF